MSKKSIIIICLIAVLVLVVIYFAGQTNNKDFDSTMGNSDWAKEYLESVADLYKDETIPPQSSPQSPLVIDVVTPISKYFVYENANGYGTITSYVDKSKNKDIKIQAEDLYLEPYFGWSDYCKRFSVIKDNKYVGILYLEFSKNENLQWGDVITVTPEFYPDDEEKTLEYFFEPVEIEVPDLGDYFVPSKFTYETISSLEDIELYEDELISLYYGEIKPGEVNAFNSPGCLIAIYGQWFSKGTVKVYFDVIVNSDGSIKSYNTGVYYDALIHGTTYSMTSWDNVENAYNNAKKYYNLQCIYNG